jgi:recombinational DNA repair ATPase RecF
VFSGDNGEGKTNLLEAVIATTASPVEGVLREQLARRERKVETGRP